MFPATAAIAMPSIGMQWALHIIAGFLTEMRSKHIQLLYEYHVALVPGTKHVLKYTERRTAVSVLRTKAKGPSRMVDGAYTLLPGSSRLTAGPRARGDGSSDDELEEPEDELEELEEPEDGEEGPQTNAIGER